MNVSALHCNEEMRVTANLQLSPKEEFEACDSFLRSYEEQVTNWPAVAQACLRVKQGELWKHGGHSSWHGWIQSAAPFSARTVFYHVRLFESLNGDYTPEELAQVPVETAKVLRSMSKEARTDPAVKQAAKRKRKAFIETVKATHPEQHIESEVVKTFRFSESQWEKIEHAIEVFRTMNNPEESVENVIESWAAEFLLGRWEDSPYTNEQRAEQLQSMGA